VSARTHPRLVGAFVLGAVILSLAAAVFLSSGRWFQTRDRFSVYFPGSIRGLNPGAPVTFRGVKVGQVVDVRAVLTGQPETPIQIEVVIEIFEDVIEVPRGVSDPFEGSATTMAKALIARGIRGKLQSQSLLTGQKYIDFDFLPDEPARFAGLDLHYPELPTTPTAMEKLGDRVEALMNKLAELPLDQMLDNLQGTLESARKLLGSPDLAGTFAGTHRGAKQLGPALEDLRAALRDARALMDRVSSQVELTGGDARHTLEDARRTLDRAQESLKSLETTVQGADEARVRASEMLDDLSRTLVAIRHLVDYIESHPEALVLGKPREKEER
jgi:paraquat-inducible protein B